MRESRRSPASFSRSRKDAGIASASIDGAGAAVGAIGWGLDATMRAASDGPEERICGTAAAEPRTP